MINCWLCVCQARRPFSLGLWWCCVILIFGACAPTPQGNVIGYVIAKRLGRFAAPPAHTQGSVRGRVLFADEPVAGVTVVLAERNGRPHSAQTNAQGHYQMDGIPPGQYALAAVAPRFEETTLQDKLGLPLLVTIRPDRVTDAPPLYLQRHQAIVLPQPLAAATQLTLTGTAIVTTTFPAGAMAQVQAFQYTYAGAVIPTLRLYLPTSTAFDPDLPLLFLVYPTLVDAWQSVSVAFAAQGFAVVAVSPVAERELNIDAHALDAQIALSLAQQGHLDPHLRDQPAVALGGSFSSAILHRLLRDLDEAEVAAWVTVGGIANAFSGAAAFYAGQIDIPPEYTYLIPALGPPNLYPLAFLRYSPVYTAAQLPPTLIIHTAADRIIPISQAYDLEAALRTAGVPVAVFYYEDVSHYLQIDDQMTDAGREMFYRVVDFAKQYRD